MKAKTTAKEDIFCPICNGEHTFIEVEKPVEQEIHGEAFTVKANVMVCRACKFETVRGGQVAELARKSLEVYRELHQLLKPEEIKGIREKLGLSQENFAKRLGVGVASLKRWELGRLQNKSSDKLIRLLAEVPPSSGEPVLLYLGSQALSSLNSLAKRKHWTLSETVEHLVKS